MSTGPKLVPFPRPDNVTCVPARLREIADDIESGKQPAEVVIVLVETAFNRGPDVWVLGPDKTMTHTIGMLTVAAVDLTRARPGE